MRATFVEGDAATWTPISSTVDLLFSNATLQWLPDHATLFPRLLSLVRPAGVLALQMPRNFDAPSHELLRETAKDGPWAKDVADLARRAPVHGPEVYTDLLEPLAASLVPKEIDVNYGILLRNLGERQDTRQPHSAA